MTRHNTFDLAVAAVIAVLLARGGPASAAIIDQQNGPGNTSFNGSAGFNWEQGVTAGITGQLVGVDIWDNSATSTTLTINRGSPWQSDANDFSQTISTTPGTWTHVDLSSANLQFTAGDQFSIGLIGLFPSSFNGSSVVDQYSGGTRG